MSGKRLTKTPAANDEQMTGTIYTYPMYPEIEQVGPGDCPICAMDLELKFASVGEQEDDGQYADMK